MPQFLLLKKVISINETIMLKHIDKILVDHSVIQANSWAEAVFRSTVKTVSSQGNLDNSKFVQHPCACWVVPSW